MRTVPTSALLFAAGALLTLAGCKNMEKPVLARTDTQLAGDIQAKLAADPTFSGPNSPNVNVAVSNGVATLSGQAADDNARALAAADASRVPGVHEVVNNLSVPTAETADACIPPAPVHASVVHRHRRRSHPTELASNFVPPAPAPAPVAPPPPACDCGPAAAVAVPAPVVVPVRPLYAYGYAPAIGVGIYARPGFVHPIRPYRYYRGGARYYRR